MFHMLAGKDVSIQPMEGSGLAGTEEVAETSGAHPQFLLNFTVHSIRAHDQTSRKIAPATAESTSKAGLSSEMPPVRH